MTDMSGYTQREVVATLINESEQVRALGVLPDNVHDADAVREPDSMDFPFVVIRWADVISINGLVHVQALDVWAYDKGSDRTRAERIALAAAEAVIAGVPVKKLGGHLTQVFDDGQGADMTDDTYDAVVVPRSLRAVGSGL